MSVLTRNPTNKSLLQTNKFKLNFGAIPAITYFCQTVNLPGLSLNEITRDTPFIDLFVPGEKLSYETLNITFLLDEDLMSWMQLHNWIRAITFPTEFDEFKDLDRLSQVSANRARAGLKPQYSDATVTVYTNKNNPNIRINFKDVFPTSLSSIVFNATDTADNIATADASFRFSYYNIETI